MDETKNITEQARSKMSSYLASKDSSWFFKIYHNRLKIGNRFNVFIGLFFMALGGYCLYVGSTPFIIAGIILGLVGIWKVLSYDPSIEASVVDYFIDKFEKF